jgi:hypothetical protein
MKKTLIFESVIMGIILMVAPLADAAGVIKLPKTGQTKCYDSTGLQVTCPGTGQDGDLQAGVAWPDPRFTVNGDCVIDNLTGLTWAKNANLPSTPLDWTGAVDFPQSLSLCGFSDWRLANVNELESLVNHNVIDNAAWLMSKGFSNVMTDYYWSSTSSLIVGTVCKVKVNLAGGTVYTDQYLGRDYYVLPVRGDTAGPARVWRTGQMITYRPGDDGDLKKGAAWPEPRFTDNGDGTATDNLTGLMWATDANTPGPPLCDSGVKKNWQSSLEHVSCLNANAYLGYTDWRLPNEKEVLSVIDRSQYCPALYYDNPFVFPPPPPWVCSYDFWSSTSTPGNGSAFEAEMAYGDMIGDSKQYPYYVWPVRGNNPILSVIRAGIGAGTVTSIPPGIDCGSACSREYPVGTQVTLAASADPGSVFSGWSGGGCSGTGDCLVTLTADTTVTATFLALYDLVIQAGGNGSGTVTGDGITCTVSNGVTGGDCSETIPEGTVLTLIANPDPGSVFMGWSGGGCPATGPCEFTLTGDTIVTATFTDTDSFTQITMVSPNGGERLPTGGTWPLVWGAPPAASQFKLSYSLDNGITWSRVSAGSIYGTSMFWTVPTFTKNKTNCLFKITAFDGLKKLGSDKSDAPFTLEALTITDINEGVSCQSGDSCPITWRLAGTLFPDQLQLSYTLNGGVTWKKEPAIATPPGSSYEWTAPTVKKSKTCRVKLTLKAGGKTVAIATSPTFTITGP